MSINKQERSERRKLLEYRKLNLYTLRIVGERHGEQLQKLQDQYDKGVLTDTEYVDKVLYLFNLP